MQPSNNFPKRIKTPTVLQIEATECGAACLRTVLGYFGRWVPMPELRTAVGVNRNGSTALGIAKAAKQFGLLVEAQKCDAETLKQTGVPSILFWRNNHFVVLEGFKTDKVFINDPAMGPQQLSFEDFKRAFSNVAITFAPGNDFVKGGKQSKFLDMLLASIQPIRKSFYFLIIIGFLISLSSLYLPAFLMYFFDNILARHYLEFTKPFVLGFGAMALLLAAMTSLKLWVSLRLYLKLSISSTSRFFWHLLYLPYNYYQQRFGAEVASRLGLNDLVASQLTHHVTPQIINVLMIFIFALVMLVIAPLIAFVSLLSALGILILMRAIYRKREDAISYYQNDLKIFAAHGIETLLGIETIKVSGTEDKNVSLLTSYFTKAINSYQKLLSADVILAVVPTLLSAVTSVLILSLGAWRIIEGTLTLGLLVALQTLMRSFFRPMTDLANLNQTLQDFRVNLDRINDVYENPIDERLLTETSKESAQAKLLGFIEVRNLTFGYSPASPPILLDIYLSLSPGKSVALVGGTGSGKSTVAKLLVGLYEPWNGKILFDGKPRSHYSADILANSIAYVEQNPLLFKDTIKNNITMYDPLISEQDIIAAAKDACIHDVIMNRKGGYNLVLETGGLNLSGGQRQRLELARLLVRNPSILILDEATSALDSTTEAEIVRNIRRRGCAILVIAHRFSTIQNCDEILFLSQGKVVQKGMHYELKEIVGQYRNLLELEKLF